MDRSALCKSPIFCWSRQPGLGELRSRKLPGREPVVCIEIVKVEIFNPPLKRNNPLLRLSLADEASPVPSARAAGNRNWRNVWLWQPQR